jgi:hypothetical protein
MRDAAVVGDLSGRISAILQEPAVNCPEPGIYPGVDFGTYSAWPAASNSRLHALSQSPAHLKAYIEEPKDTTTLTQGRAIHAAILEPDEFVGRYARFDGDRRTKDGRAKYEALCQSYGEGCVIKAADFDNCVRVRDRVFKHSQCARLLEGRHELSIVWVDPESGVTCKARLDCHAPHINGGAIVDVKSTRDASPRAFALSVRKYGYYRQAAFYLAGARVLGINCEHFVNIACESDVPFNVQPYRMNEGAIDAGTQELKWLLSDYKELMEQPLEDWPVGYSPEIEHVTLPDYAWSQIDEDLKGRAS